MRQGVRSASAPARPPLGLGADDRGPSRSARGAPVESVGRRAGSAGRRARRPAEPLQCISARIWSVPYGGRLPAPREGGGAGLAPARVGRRHRPGAPAVSGAAAARGPACIEEGARNTAKIGKIAGQLGKLGPAGLRHRVRSSRWQRCRPLGRRPHPQAAARAGPGVRRALGVATHDLAIRERRAPHPCSTGWGASWQRAEAGGPRRPLGPPRGSASAALETPHLEAWRHIALSLGARAG